MTSHEDNGEPFEKVDISGVGVSAIDMPMALKRIDRWITLREQNYVCVATTHSINECQHDPYLRQIHNNAGMVTPDGMPLVWVSHLKGYTAVRRVYGPDLMLDVCEQSLARGYKHFLYGGWPPDLVEKLAKRLRHRFPGIAIVGTHAPPLGALTPEEDKEIVRKIDATDPDIVWVGLGAPKQERFVAEHIGRLRAPLLIGVGAAFDFHAGTKRQAPRWMMRAGFEWFFRMMNEPLRLGPRYLVNNPRFLRLMLREAFGRRSTQP